MANQLSSGCTQQHRSRVYCERIICLWSETVPRGWWHELEDEQELLFATGGRIVEAPLAEASKAVAAAVHAGCRPVLFVPSPMDWPLVSDALDPYRASADLLVWTRDDDLMRDLLHFPSAEIQAIAGTKGTIIVPNVAYGRHLDLLLPVSLGDFIAEPMSACRQNDTTFTYFSRLNPFRQIELAITPNVTRATLKQFYLGDESTSQAACTLPVQTGDEPLIFDSNGHCLLAPAQHPLSLIVRALHPALWRVESIWRTLVGRLRGMSTGSYLSTLQQILLFNSADPDGSVLPARVPTRGAENRQTELSPYPSPLLIAVAESVQAGHGGQPRLRAGPKLNLTVRWLPETAKPKRRPAIQVFYADVATEANWVGEGCEAIFVRCAPSTDMQIRWSWSPEKGSLSIWLSPSATAPHPHSP